MFKKLAMASCISLGALTGGAANAALVPCDAIVANAVTGDTSCQYSNLQPANEGDATVTSFVNSEEYFGNDDWTLAGSLGIGGGTSGSWSLAGFNTSTWDDVMLLFKSGQSPHIGYLVEATSGTWTTPFLSPPFDLPGNSTQQAVSFIRVYYTPGEGPGPGPGPEPGGKVPEPATLGLLGLGMIGLFAMRRRRQ